LHGYKNASTNRIVKRLRISKGALFLYFGDKKSLYLYIVDYAVETIVNKFLSQLNDQDGLKTFDFFKDFDWIKGYYSKIIQEDTFLLNFAVRAILGTGTPEELGREVAERHKRHRELLLHRINTDNFRADIDPGKAMELLLIVSDHVKSIFAREVMDKSGNLLPEDTDKYRDLYNEYLVDKFLELYKDYLKIIQYGICEKPK
jgi:AcrR family transcriptional regulator